tara:strand:+ start:8266 stop:8547 length:282 start_codon:yes stop_codon:yes gene_type:complete
VRLAITYEAIPNESSTKYIQVTEWEAAEFLAELNNGAAFPCLQSQDKCFIFPADKIYGIYVEEEDVSEVGKGQGEEASTVGGRTASERVQGAD